MKVEFKTSDYLNFFRHPMLGTSLQNWVRVLWRAGFRIHPAFLLRFLFITGNAVLNVPFQWVEFLLYNHKIRRQKVHSPVFIIGHPRSGTTHLHYLLSKDPQFAYCTVYQAMIPHIFLTSGRALKGLVKSALPETRPQDKMPISIDSPKEEEFAMANSSRTSYMFTFYFPRRAVSFFKESVTFSESPSDRAHWMQHFNAFVKKLSFANKGKRLLLKSPANTARVSEILELYPDAKFIHIHRDPLEVYRSTVRLYEKVLPGTSFQKADGATLESYIVQSYRWMFEKYYTDRQTIPDEQLVEIAFDDLEQRPLETLERVYRLLGMEWSEETKRCLSEELKASSDYQKNTYDPLPKETREHLRKEWGDIANRMGYTL